MMTNKERIIKLIEHIKRLETITEEIQERDIYPVSFFSMAFDITNKIQEDLQQIEIYQIDLFETQKQEHQAHILSTVRQPINTVIQEDTEPAQQDPNQAATLVHTNKLAEPIEPAIKQPPLLSSQQEVVVKENVLPLANSIQEMAASVKASSHVFPVQEENKVIPAYSAGNKNVIELKKMIRLNDRFLFCRELFANNENLMNQTISELNMEESYDSSIDYLNKRFDWNFEDEHVADFLAILKKRFS